MGVADRGYMRDRRPPPIGFGTSWTLRAIVALVVLFVASKGAEGWFHWYGWRDWLLLSREGLARGRVWTLLTAALFHADAWHLVFNCLGLWFFGKLVEETLGARKYLVFLLLAAVLSHVPFVAAEFLAHGNAITIGASGVVMAALVFAAFRYPGAPFTLIVFPLKLWQIALLYVGLDAYAVLTRSGSGIDHWSHLGGAAFGWAAHRFGVPTFSLPRRRRARAAGAGPLPHGGRPPRDAGPFAGGNSAREVDRILDKINAKGIGSLTEAEREFLKRQSGR